MINMPNDKGLYNFFYFSLSLLFVAVVLEWSYKDTKITFEEDGLKIHGMYGGFCSWDEMKNLELKDSLPTIQLKVNGSSLCGKLKGHFRTKELGNIKLFLNKRISPFIYFDLNGKKIIFNLANSETTKLAYEILLEKTKM